MTGKENKLLKDGRNCDIRIVEFNIRKGEMDKSEYKTYLKDLPDDASRGEYIEITNDKPKDEATPHLDELTFTA